MWSGSYSLSRDIVFCRASLGWTLWLRQPRSWRCKLSLGPKYCVANDCDVRHRRRDATMLLSCWGHIQNITSFRNLVLDTLSDVKTTGIYCLILIYWHHGIETKLCCYVIQSAKHPSGVSDNLIRRPATGADLRIIPHINLSWFGS